MEEIRVIMEGCGMVGVEMQKALNFRAFCVDLYPEPESNRHELALTGV